MIDIEIDTWRYVNMSDMEVPALNPNFTTTRLGRYSDETLEAQYHSLSPFTNFAEATSHARPNMNTVKMVQTRVKAKNILDLTDPETARHFMKANGDDATLLMTSPSLGAGNMPDYLKFAETRKMAKALKAQGVDGIIVPSARNVDGAPNLVLFDLKNADVADVQGTEILRFDLTQ